MKKLMLAVAITALMSSPARAGDNDWSTTDKALFATYTVFNVVDILQTRYIFESDEYVELNPILAPLGKNGATAAMIGANVAMYFIADYVGQKYRPIVLGTVATLSIGVTAHNYSIGIGFSF